MKGKIQLEGKVWAAGHGFQIKDAAVSWSGEFTNPGVYDGDAIGVAPGVVGVTDLSRAAGLIPVIVELLDRAPSDDDVTEYDGVTDAPLELTSGVLRVEGDVETFRQGVITVPRFEFCLEPGSYRVRVAYANCDSSRYDYADGADHVRLSLWPSAAEPLRVQKKKENEDDPVKEYRGARSSEELASMLRGPSISHRCLAVVALARRGETGVLSDLMSNNPFDSVFRVYLSALGFAGEAALPLLEEERYREDRDLRLRIVQSLRHVGGEAAKALALKVAEGVDFEMLAEAARDVE